MNISSGRIIRPQKVVIYGPEGIGKSTFAARFPNPVFIDTEGSTIHMDVCRFDAPSSWEMLLEEVQYIIAHPDGYKTLVIDTADWAERLCVEKILATYEKKGVEDFGYGKGYVYVAELFGKLLDLLSEVINKGLNVVITAHAKMRKFEQPDEMGAYDRWEMKLSKQVAPMVKEWADMVLFATYKTIVIKEGKGDGAKNKAQGGRRVMYTSHHPCWDAKNRHNLPEIMDFDYSGISHCFDIPVAPKDLRPPVTTSAPITATASPQAENTAQLPQMPPRSATPDVQTIIDHCEQNGVKVEYKPNIPPDLPKALRDLMEADGVDERDIRFAVANKGFFPFDTPITNYPEDFINGALIAGWSELRKYIVTNGDLPFD